MNVVFIFIATTGIEILRGKAIEQEMKRHDNELLQTFGADFKQLCFERTVAQPLTVSHRCTTPKKTKKASKATSLHVI